ncbi:hypothetical protein HPP92_010832 [Vanilla planifolia]|uniref:Uncharacterized protein n=1 Tax=Vanilla planifolia TaxID=51239 RepID=A0A835V1G4_VANPL|nr:hypothetical protein HPP92_011093 [Vanilla planifolia]KAG0482748.1 hypothetical protein HPP92_010832 [Vanilla planifolia]
MSPYWSEEAFDVFYSEIEERIMLVISEEEEDAKKGPERAPLRPLNRSPLMVPPKSAFLHANWYASFDTAAKERDLRFGRGNGKKVAYEAGGRRGTGVFIPRSDAYRK